MVAQTGVDAIGLNFFEGSRRCVTVETAVAMARQLPPDALRVGVFVNASIDAIRQTQNRVGLDLIQLHGDEPAEFVDELSDMRVLRAFRCQDDLTGIERYLDCCKTPPEAVLIDAYDPHEYGGTGKTLNWEDVGRWSPSFGSLPIILAGGLTPQNVGRAIDLAGPAGVDVASGVEKNTPGRKDPILCQQFVAAAHSAFSLKS